MTLMKRNIATIALALAGTALAGAAMLTATPVAAKAQKQASRPNIIWMMVDDMGYGDLGVTGQEKIATPNLDRMAREGILLTQYYAGSTVCAPSRSVLMTGYHVGHTSVRGNGSKKVQRLLPEDVTVAELLKTAGYQTALIGKWGLGDEGDNSQPTDQGFDYFFGFLNQVHAHNHFPDWVWRNKEKVRFANKVILAPEAYQDFRGGAVKPEDRLVFIEDEFRQEALSFIGSANDKGKPFFLYYALVSPHANNEADKIGLGLHGMNMKNYGDYANKPWPDAAKGYAAMMQHIDQSVGKIMAELTRLGIADNTVFIFTSDNGPHSEGGNDPAFFKSSGPFRGEKRSLTDGGVRVPVIAWGPGLVRSGVRSDHIGYFWDFWATAAEFAGIKNPPGGSRDGSSIAPLLTGKGPAKQRDYVYWEFYEFGSAQAVKMGKWKAIKKPMFTGKIELYDSSVDVEEKNDIAAQNPELVAKMEAIMQKEHVPDPRWKPQLGVVGNK
jgi:arylsulfatase A-like enzyme